MIVRLQISGFRFPPSAFSFLPLPLRLKRAGSDSKCSLLGKKEKDPTLPRRVLYATSARLGGTGLDSVAYETVVGLFRAKILKKAIAFDNCQSDVPAARIKNLKKHPVRLLSFLDSAHYYGAKKHTLDRVAARTLGERKYQIFHGWSGECLLSLRAARKWGIASVIEIPTWHRNKGMQKGRITDAERQALLSPWHRRMIDSLLVTRQQVLEEYDLADLILVLSEFAEQTFLAAGVPKEKLFRTSRGVDPERFKPAGRPPNFRAIFVGALIKRKGVHHLLEAWHRLNLKDAELYLVGSVHPEIRPYLDQYQSPSVKVLGFSPRAEECFQQSTIHVFPSSCEGSAKATYEAAACGLPQVTTRESGDVVVDGLNGLIVSPGDVEGIAAAIERLYRDPDLVETMGKAARERILSNFTWDHYRQRVLDAYREVLRK